METHHHELGTLFCFLSKPEDQRRFLGNLTQLRFDDEDARCVTDRISLTRIFKVMKLSHA